VIYLIGFLVALDYLGVSITPLITALGVGGLAVALALQDTLSNLFSGLNILMTRKIRPGDFIRLDTGEEGVVCDITWRNTTIRALENNMVIVPNGKLGGAIVTNTHLPEKEMGLFVPVTVAFDNDLALVERVTLEVAREVLTAPERAIPGFGEVMRQRSLATTPNAMLSRAMAGIRGRTLIINLPGSPGGAVENLEAVWPAVPHAVAKIQGDQSDCVPLS